MSFFARTVRAGPKAGFFRRAIHTVPTLKNEELYRREGIKGLYSPEQFKLAWNDYQTLVTTKLSALTSQTDNETRSPVQIIQNTSRDSSKAAVFNNASQAFNNHFFFEALCPENTSSPSSIYQDLQVKINKSFGSLENLQGYLLFKADTMPGNGWVFLVERADKSLDIITCNNAGTPFDFASNQSLDFNHGFSGEEYEAIQEKAREMQEAQTNHTKIRDWTLPLLAVNVWEYAYVKDYGPIGRDDYLANWWNCIDWSVVSNRAFTV